ncbi:carbohydrate ABC transporter permease [Egibacter rhizosphaerae]|uniref:Carbohydrate ABC transporter permease n=2 Tax=Egibacter rhizosphaerae TaxID=1670831 RepID=A0A411YLH0_9ACTN|nr:carbohydrate ABC transporter permease [Egibacter rhizosphaerae]
MVLARIGFYLFVVLVGLFFALPVLWLVVAPFDETPGLSVAVPELTLQNFREVMENPFALRSLLNSLILAIVTTLLVVASASLSAYALSRVRLPGRDVLLYVLLLFSAVVTGTAAMVPLFRLVFEIGLMDTHTAVILVMAGGLLPAGVFILKDFMDTVPRSYEESALVAGASSLQILRDIVAPVVRPGLAVIGVWALVQVWGNFLVPFILLRSSDLNPAAVVMYNFYTEGGIADLSLLSAFSLIYTIPVVALYLFVQRRYGFRFYGGIKS